MSPLVSRAAAAAGACATSKRATSAWPLAAAVCSAVEPPWFCALASAPASSKNATAAAWFFDAAWCSAEWPSDDAPRVLTARSVASPPRRRRSVATSPRWAAASHSSCEALIAEPAGDVSRSVHVAAGKRAACALLTREGMLGSVSGAAARWRASAAKSSRSRFVGGARGECWRCGAPRGCAWTACCAACCEFVGERGARGLAERRPA